jgi:hypothetical protein
MDAEYPSNCIKGIPHKDFLLEGGFVRPDLFNFDSKHLRKDGWIEQSINWEDNETVIEFTLKQVKGDGDIHFKAGVALIPTEELDRLKRRPSCKDKIAYERKRLEDNPYHGNLLILNDLPKHVKKAIPSYLMLSVSHVVPLEDVCLTDVRTS